MDPGIRRIGIILFEGADLLDAVGPAGAFAAAPPASSRGPAPRPVTPSTISRRTAARCRRSRSLAVETLKLRDSRPANMTRSSSSAAISDGRMATRGWSPGCKRNRGRMRRLARSAPAHPFSPAPACSTAAPQPPTGPNAIRSASAFRPSGSSAIPSSCRTRASGRRPASPPGSTWRWR